MKRKIFYIIIMMLLFIPISVNAENKIYFDLEESKIAPGTKKELKIKVDSDTEFTKVNFNLITTSLYVGFYSVNFSDDFVRNSVSSTGSNYELEAKKPMKSGTVIGTVTLFAKESSPIGSEGYIRLTKTSITSESLIELPMSQVKMIVSNEKSSNNNLSNLSSSLVNIDFNKDVLEYTVYVDNSTQVFDLSATVEDLSATVVISDQNLKKKKNIINVVVTSEEGKEKLYKVTVIKKEQEEKITEERKEITKSKKENVKSGFVGILSILVIILAFDLLYIKKKK